MESSQTLYEAETNKLSVLQIKLRLMEVQGFTQDHTSRLWIKVCLPLDTEFTSTVFMKVGSPREVLIVKSLSSQVRDQVP